MYSGLGTPCPQPLSSAVAQDLAVAGVALQVVPLNEVLNPLFNVRVGGLKAQGQLLDDLQDEGAEVQALAGPGKERECVCVCKCGACVSSGMASSTPTGTGSAPSSPPLPLPHSLHDPHNGSVSHGLALGLHLRLHVIPLHVPAPAIPSSAAATARRQGGGRDEGDAHAEELGGKLSVHAQHLLWQQLLALRGSSSSVCVCVCGSECVCERE